MYLLYDVRLYTTYEPYYRHVVRLAKELTALRRKWAVGVPPFNSTSDKTANAANAFSIFSQLRRTETLPHCMERVPQRCFCIGSTYTNTLIATRR